MNDSNKFLKFFNKIPKPVLNLCYTLIIGFVLYFLVLLIPFLISRILPGDPVLPYLPPTFTPEQYNQMYHQLGFDRPPFEQFILYLFRMFTGNWGVSQSIAHGLDVSTLMKTPIPITIDLLLLPLLIGTILGLLFGNLCIKLKRKWLDKMFQTLAIFGCALPIFFLGMLFQYVLGYVVPLFPTTGFKTYTYPDPPFVSGFRIIDSMLSGQFYLIPDYLYHLILPWSILTIGIGSLTTLLTRIYLKNRPKRSSIVPNSFNFGITFGVIFAYLIFIESTFGLNGFANLFIQSIRYADYWVLNAIIFLIPLVFVSLFVLSNLIYTGYGALRPLLSKKLSSRRTINKNPNEEVNESPPSNNNNENIIPKGKEQNRTEKDSFKTFSKYFLKKLKSPFTIIGLVFIVFFVLISIFPQILTPYTFEQANGVYLDSWFPPSPLHPLGQTKFGRDVFARIVYGIQNSLLSSLIPIGIGLLGGLLIGIPMSLLNRRFRIKMSVEISLIFLFIYPMIMTVIIIPMIGLGLLLIPFFTLIIAKTRFNGFNIMKKVIPYIPLFFGFIMLVQLGTGFLGFSNPFFITLGNEMSIAREFLYSAPWATFFPGLFSFLLVFGFFLLYLGLQKSVREN